MTGAKCCIAMAMGQGTLKHSDGVIANIVWCIWKDQNSLMFEGKAEEPRRIVEKGLAMSIEHFKLKKEVEAAEEDRKTSRSWGFSNVRVRQVEEQYCECKLLAPSWVKLNCDGSMRTGSEEAGRSRSWLCY